MFLGGQYLAYCTVTMLQLDMYARYDLSTGLDYSFGSCVGQFVLTASLRSQVNPENRSEFKDISPERYVYADAVLRVSHVFTTP